MVFYLVPLASSLAAFIAGTLMFTIYRRSGEKTFIVASASMYLFSFGTFLEFVSSYLEFWPEILYRLYYGTSPIQPALLAAAVLGLYTYSEFQGHRRIYRYYLGYASLLGTLVFILSLVAKVNTELLSNQYIGGAAMASYVRILSPPLTIPSAILLISYPIYVYFKGSKHIDKLIFPVAALIVGIGGVMIRRGLVTLFYIFELTGAFLLLIGFYLVYKRAVEVKS